MICVCLAAARPAPCAGADHEASAVRHLQRTAIPQPDGSHLPRLAALRQLHDPALAPLFAPITQEGTWQMQVHAALGLAELEEDRRLPPGVLANLTPAAQESLLANAMDLDLLGTDALLELAARRDIPAAASLMLQAELVDLGHTPAASRIRELGQGADLRSAGLAAFLLAETGDPSALDTFDARLRALSTREREFHETWLLEAARQYTIDRAQPWVERVIARHDGPGDTVGYWAVLTLLLLDGERGLDACRRALGADPSYRDRVRFGLLLLTAAPHLPPSAFDLVGDDTDLTARMAAAGRAVAGGGEAATRLTALLDLGHPRTAEWVMRTTAELPEAQRCTVYLHIMRDAMKGEERPENVARAVEATARLFAIAPELVIAELENVEDDSFAQEFILLGLFETDSPLAGAAAARLRRIGAGRADSLTLLLMARHHEGMRAADAEVAELSAGDLDHLGRIAAGGGRLSTGLQAQAAWLYLKHTNGIDDALGVVFNDPRLTSGDQS